MAPGLKGALYSFIYQSEEELFYRVYEKYIDDVKHFVLQGKEGLFFFGYIYTLSPQSRLAITL